MGRSITQSTISGLMPFGQGVVIAYLAGATFSVPTGISKIRVTVIGGGSGGLCSCHASSGKAWPNFGGSGGGFALKTVDVSAGDAFLVTPGAGGLGRIQYNGTVVPQAATAGGTTSFGSVISATGGGVATVGTGAGSPGVVGAPGQGFGGDVNFSGGRGGTIDVSATPATSAHAMGGGAAGHHYGDGGRGGDIISMGATDVLGMATGGGGVGGYHGGDIAGDAGFPGQYLASGGGGTGGSAITPASGGYTSVAGGVRNRAFQVFAGEDAGAVPYVPMWHLLLPLIGVGQGVVFVTDVWNATGSPSRGAGTAGRLGMSTNGAGVTAATALVCGGGGAAVHLSTTDGIGATGGDGGFGGGGGAASAASGLNIYMRGGNGGQGIVIVEY
ncbi:MAG: hypothetical protein KF796_19415 [Ramlibacter sp.]|nr:hypothetical protein [Ramlibacter sp.]